MKTHSRQDTVASAPFKNRTFQFENKLPGTHQSYPVLNMHCASCAARVEQVVQKMPGVSSASVNLATNMLTVDYTEKITSVLSIQKALQQAGYDLIIEPRSSQRETSEMMLKKAYQKQKNNTLWSIILMLPISFTALFYMNQPFAPYLMWALATPIVCWFGRSFFTRAWKQAKQRNANMDTLVAISTGIAYVFSVFNNLWPDFWLQKGLQPHVYYEVSAGIITFILIGKTLEAKAKLKASASINQLMDLQPREVRIIDANGQIQTIHPDNLKKGAMVLVRPGEKIAADGILIEGSSYVDESLLSGEPLPVHKKVSDEVYAGSLNQKGSFQFKARKTGQETKLAHIIQMVEQALESKAPVQKQVDKIAAIFVPTVLGLSLATLITWLFIGGENQLFTGIMASVSVLVIACPCALGLATPTAMMVGIGKGASKGILIKDAESLELARNIDILVLDKTGTITEGKPKVVDSAWVDNDELYKHLLMSIENHSDHPLAESIVEYYKTSTQLPLEDNQALPGKGITARFQGQSYYVGNRNLLESHQIQIAPALLEKEKAWMEQSHSIVWFANQEKTLAIVAVSDPVKHTSIEAIRKLQQQHIEVHMLTGDHPSVAAHVAAATGIKYFEAGILPEQKGRYISELKAGGKCVAMVGDGINDSAALALADVSIAMGKGSDLVKDLAHMTLVSSDLLKVSEAIQISKNTVRIIRQNLFWAFIYNVIGIPIAAGVLYPALNYLLNPMLAGAAMALSSLFVVLNSLRIHFTPYKH